MDQFSHFVHYMFSHYVWFWLDSRHHTSFGIIMLQDLITSCYFHFGQNLVMVMDYGSNKDLIRTLDMDWIWIGMIVCYQSHLGWDWFTLCSTWSGYICYQSHLRWDWFTLCTIWICCKNVINLEIDPRCVQSDANDTETSFITSLVWAYSYNMMRFHSYLDAQDSKWLSISSWVGLILVT